MVEEEEMVEEVEMEEVEEERRDLRSSNMVIWASACWACSSARISSMSS